MAEADAVSTDMFELQAHASRAIAQATGAEAGMVTSGAAAGLLLAAAACLAGLDVGRMNTLPDTDGPFEIVVARSHRNGYDHALKAAGARLVEVGMAESFAGTGIRDAEPWEYEGAVGPRTAAILFVESSRARPSLAEVAEVARRCNVPLIVDAAAQLPPGTNLKKFIEEGADLVVYSGGKALGGPAGTGILCGRRILVMSAAMQMLDMDLDWSEWQPPADFIDTSLLRGLPRQGIGRSCKVGKHEVFGLLAALDHFLQESDASRNGRLLDVCRQIEKGIAAAAGFAAAIEVDKGSGGAPLLVLKCAGAEDAARIRASLIARPQPVHTGTDPFRPDCLIVSPVCLRPSEIPQLVDALSC